MKSMVISVFGLGHVGLTFAVCLAHRGFQVIGYDVDEKKIRIILKGQVPFYEPRLSQMLQSVIKQNKMHLAVDPKKAVLESNITFITVSTPENSNGGVNLNYVADSLKIIGQTLSHKSEWHLVVIRSTVPPGTSLDTIKVLEKFSGKKCGIDFGLCYNPEFLSEGSAVDDIFYPDRIIIGEYNNRSGDILEELYNRFHGRYHVPIIRTSLTNAELIKYANNAFLAMKVSFINMIANLCEKYPNADVVEVAKGIGLDRRIGHHFLNAGAGWGGSCWPKDLKALIHTAKQKNIKLPLVEATIEVNDDQPYRLVELSKNLLGALENMKIAVLGLAYKPNTDDVRNAISIKIINKLLKEKAKVVVYDPKAMGNAKKIFGNKIEYANSAIRCLENADCALIVTEWSEFKKLKPEDFVRQMRKACIVDGRRIYNPVEFKDKLKFAAVGYASNSTCNN